MKKRLLRIFWAVGTGGAVVWTCFWTIGFVYGMRRHWAHIHIALIAALFGAWLIREGFKAYREEKEPRLPNRLSEPTGLFN